MPVHHFQIEPDIRRAATLPGRFYHSPEVFDQCREHLFARSWQCIAGAEDVVRRPYDALPFRFMDHFMEEPLLLLRDADNRLCCSSNVCTHRGNILVEHPGRLERGLVCGYHGRRFGLDGRFMAMPETNGMENFPCADDHLTQLPVQQWRQFIFTSLSPVIPFAEWVEPLERKVGFLPIEQFRFDAARSRDYLVRCNWALYCDNYLEGFHIPFIHKGLAGIARLEGLSHRAVPLGQLPGGREQGWRTDSSICPRSRGFRPGHFRLLLLAVSQPDVQFLSLGLVAQHSAAAATGSTKVSFRTYVFDETKLHAGAGADVDLVEREDEAVVEQVQIGTRSRFYRHGRFSPNMEKGVHQFHRLVAEMLTNGRGQIAVRKVKSKNLILRTLPKSGILYARTDGTVKQPGLWILALRHPLPLPNVPSLILNTITKLLAYCVLCCYLYAAYPVCCLVVSTTWCRRLRGQHPVEYPTRAMQRPAQRASPR